MRFFQKKKKGADETTLRLPGNRSILDLFAKHFSETTQDLNSSLEEVSQKLTVTKSAPTQETIEGRSIEVLRLVVYNSSCGLSVRALGKDTVEVFLLPASQLALVPQTEYPSRLKFKLQHQQDEWWLDGHPVTDTELRMLVLTMTNDLLKYSHKSGSAPIAEGARIRIGELSLTTGLRDLLFEKAQLVTDLVSQQEALQAHLAGELHDSVIADLLFLNRELSSDREIPTNRICAAIEMVVMNLRGICADFSSRELRDWGLSHCLMELQQRLSERSGQQIVASVGELAKPLSFECSLQIYRIAQEVLNNAIKHAQSKTIRLSFSCSASDLFLTVEDDGIGFSSLPAKDTRQGGMGIPLLKERSEILTAMGLPSSISIDSQPGSGTKIVLRVDVSSLKS